MHIQYSNDHAGYAHTTRSDSSRAMAWLAARPCRRALRRHGLPCTVRRTAWRRLAYRGADRSAGAAARDRGNAPAAARVQGACRPAARLAATAACGQLSGAGMVGSRGAQADSAARATHRRCIVDRRTDTARGQLRRPGLLAAAGPQCILAPPASGGCCRRYPVLHDASAYGCAGRFPGRLAARAQAGRRRRRHYLHQASWSATR
jgi:hypothetical protein